MSEPSFPLTGLGGAVKARAISLRNTLAGAGIPASLEPDQVSPERGGGAWVSMRTLTPLTLDEGWLVRFHIYLIAPDVGVMEAIDILAALLTKTLTVVEPDEPINTATSVTLPHTPSQPLPAFLVIVDEAVDAYEE